MSALAVFILAALIAAYLLELVASILNLRALDSELPESFRGVYDQQAYASSQDYTRARTRLGLVSSTFGLTVLLVFWFWGGFNRLDELVRAWQLGAVWTGLFYLGILTLGRAVLALPFSIYSTFVIEERFGFNRTTLKTFVADHLKGLLLAVILGAPLLAAVIVLFQLLGARAWVLCWALAAAFSLFVQYVFPTWILPLFLRFSPLAEGELKSAILTYLESVKFPIQEIFVVDGSRRSSKSNAFFTGFGRRRRIALYDTLTDNHTVPELVAVLAHEVGHSKKRHTLQSLLIGIAHLGWVLLLFSLLFDSEALFAAFYVEQMSVHAGLVLFTLLYTPLEVALSLLLSALSRRHELQADRFAAQTVGSPRPLVDALKKLSVDNLSNLTPHPFYVAVHHSHPPVLQRIRVLESLPAFD